MNDGRFPQIKRLVLAASDLPRGERQSFLDRECGDDTGLRREVEAYLAQTAVLPPVLRTEFLGKNLARAGAGLADGDTLPRHIGRYELVEMLGRGGMGVVYRARQSEPIRREVALKLVRSGIDIEQFHARFELERQTLALMDHPHIARILDAGTDATGGPFYVMELVAGEPITSFCSNHGLPLAKMLQLAADIARAVHHAHQKGVIHRDLKPSNILVGKVEGVPTPRIIDFGVAKVIEAGGMTALELTREGQPVGSVKYMSPEQARGHSRDVDVRSDVYSLGTILYEMVVGCSPLAADKSSLLELLKAVCDDDPPPFRDVLAADARVDADVEIIVRKCLDKDPERRYQSAEALADDLERFLARRPIAARPVSAAYQLRRFAQRNRLATVLGATLVLLTVGFGIWMSALYAVADRNFRHAVRAEGEAEGVAGFMTDIFNISDPGESRGNAVTAREILDRGAARIEAELGDQPEIQARLMHNMGLVYRGLGIYDESRRLLEQARIVRRPQAPDAVRDELQADILNDLAAVERLEGRLDAAADLYRRSLDIKTDLFAPDDPKLAASLNNLGLIELDLGRYAAADSLLDQARGIFLRTSPNTSELAATMGNLARARYELGRLDEAEDLYRATVVLRGAIHEPDHPEVARALNNLAGHLAKHGRTAEALPVARRALAIWEQALGPDHPDLAVALSNLAEMHRAVGDLDAAEPLYVRALGIQELGVGTENLGYAVTLNNLGLLYRDQGRLEEAEGCLRRSLDIRRQVLGPDHPKVATALNGLGEICLERGRLAEAESLFSESIALRTGAYGSEDTRTALPMHNLGVLRLRTGNLDEADALLTHALRVREENMDADHKRIAESLTACMELRLAQGRDDDAAVYATRLDALGGVGSGR